MAAVISHTSHSISRLAAEAELLKCLECPTCQTVLMTAPIHYCERGHSVCSICIKNIRRCGICRANISNARNYSLESIANISLFKCPYEEDGCKERIRGEDLQRHLEICEYRPVKCGDSCSTKDPIPLGTFVTHLVGIHQIEKWCINKRNFTLQSHVSSFADCLWPVKCVELQENGDTFFKHERILNGVYSIWITYLGSERKAKEFVATLLIRSNDRQAHKVKWKIAVHSFRRNVNELENHIHVLIPVEELETIATRNRGGTIEWTVDYTINTTSNSLLFPKY